MKQRITLLALGLVLLTGCLKENEDGCPTGNLELPFTYTINTDSKDHLKEQIGLINLYIFDDATGLLVKIVQVFQEQLIRGVFRTELPAGQYSFVAWSIGGRDMTEGGYMPVEMTDEASDNYITTVTIGQTTIDKFRVRMRTTDSGLGYKIPETKNLTDLFHASAKGVVVTGEEQTIAFDFTKNTNILKVRIEGMEYLLSRVTSPVTVYAMGTDDRYDVNNKALTSASVRYEQPHIFNADNSVETNIKVLKLDKVLHTTNPIMLHLTRNDSGGEFMTPIDVLASILALVDENGNLIYRTQEDLDRHGSYEFLIKIDYNLKVTVTINGFEIEDTTGEIN